LEKQRKKQGADSVKVAADRSQEARALRDVIADQLTQVLAEVDRVRPLQAAPAQVERFVAATERTLAGLQERRRSEEARLGIAPPGGGTGD
jgi:uncharacterized protein YicC (UPF0701 family)